MAELLEEAADALEKKRSQPMPQSPGDETICGYLIRDLVIFADACRVAGVGPKGLKDFVGNVEATYDAVLKAMDEHLARCIDDAETIVESEGDDV